MSTQLNLGDVVQLKSGGPDMTVMSINTIEYTDKPTVNLVFCQWFLVADVKEHEFPSGSLMLASEQI